TYYYNKNNNYYLFLSNVEEVGLSLNIMSIINGKNDEHLNNPVPINNKNECKLKLSVRYDKLQYYYYHEKEQSWVEIGTSLDASKISDDNAERIVNGVMLDQGFSGAFVGLCCQDLSGQKRKAYFDYLTYSEIY